MTVGPSEATRGDFQVVIMAKAPVPGAVKTRLCPPLTLEQAAAVAAAALVDTAAAVAASGARRRVLALEGTPGRWVPPGFAVIGQRPGEFGARLAGAIDDAWTRDPLPVLVVGMDTPQLDAATLDRAAETLWGDGPTGGGDSAVLGPAEDGGYWIIGVRRPVPGLFDGVPMSTERTAAAQLARLGALGVACTLVGTVRDVDEIDDALAVAELAPDTCFAATLRPMVEGVPAMALAACGGRAAGAMGGR
jgi:uncharacterized protein